MNERQPGFRLSLVLLISLLGSAASAGMTWGMTANRLANGEDVLLEIDYQGALQVRESFPQAVLIFILPPSWEELRSRLENRGEDAPEVIELRMKNAEEEMAQVGKFDFVIINELFESALFDLKAIIHAQRLKYVSQRRLRGDVFDSLNLS